MGEVAPERTPGRAQRRAEQGDEEDQPEDEAPEGATHGPHPDEVAQMAGPGLPRAVRPADHGAVLDLDQLLPLELLQGVEGLVRPGRGGETPDRQGRHHVLRIAGECPKPHRRPGYRPPPRTAVGRATGVTRRTPGDRRRLRLARPRTAEDGLTPPPGGHSVADGAPSADPSGPAGRPGPPDRADGATGGLRKEPVRAMSDGRAAERIAKFI